MTIKLLYDYIDPHKGIIPNLELIFGNSSHENSPIWVDALNNKEFISSYTGAALKNWFYPIHIQRVRTHTDDIIIKPGQFDLENHFYSRLSVNLKSGLEKNNGYIILDISEPMTIEFIEALCEKIDKGEETTVNQNKVFYDKILVRSTNIVNHKNFLKIPSEFDFLEVQKYNNKKDLILPKKDFSFLCRHTGKSAFRQIIMLLLQKNNLLPNGYVSGYKGYVNNHDYKKMKVKYNVIDSVDSNLPLEVLDNSYINIVPEILMENYRKDEIGNDIILTEKTFRNFLWRKPFLLFGQPNSLKQLKNLGYKTFDIIFDESYDSENDITTRFKKIIQQISWWCSLKVEQKDMYINTLKPILEHNFNLYSSYVSSEHIESELKKWITNG